MIDIARSRLKDDIELRVVDGETLPYAAETFDIALTVTVLQHNQDDVMSHLLSEICRVSRWRVYLFEDVAERAPSRGAMFFRPIAGYADVAKRSGFELIEARPLGVHISELAGRLLRRATLSRRPEGSPSTRRHVIAEKAALPLLKRMDAILPQHRGITMMVFERSRDSGAQPSS